MRRLALILTSFLMLVCCDTVHQWPEPGCEVDPTDLSAQIDVTCEIELDIEKIITKGALSPEYTDADKYLRRYHINIYGEGREGNELVFSDVFFQETATMDPLTFGTTLHAKKYQILVWMDYVLADSREKDLFYNTSSGLAAIRVPDRKAYTANCDFKDAQTLLYPVDLTGSREWFKHIVITVPLQRPVAKVTFEAVDFADFAAKMGYKGDLDEYIGNFHVNVYYNGYIATGFNAETQNLNDALTGYSYTSQPYNLQGGQLTRLGFDYLFVNGEKSSVMVSVEITDGEGKVINRVDDITVPTFRGKETVVREKFFTKEYYPGIGINPEFDGEFNIYV